MTKSILTLLGVIFCNLLQAQQFNPTIISSGGGFMSNTNVKTTFTLGEPVSGDLSNGVATFNQGFQHNWIISPSKIHDNLLDNSIIIYPNPTSDLITIKFKTDNYDASIIELVDINGKVILSKKNEVNKTEHQINLSNYQTNIYFIRISTPTGKLLGTYKIQKN
jgi:hypothetical protein